MASLTAKNQGPVTAAKPAMAALTAIMRQLPILANALPRDARPGTPKVA